MPSVLILAGAVLLGAVLAIVAMVLGLWFAGRLTGTMGAPMLAVDPDGHAIGAAPYGQPPEVDEGPELAPWEGDEPPQEGVDLGKDPDNWQEVPA